MQNFATLKKAGKNWIFASEAALEDFIWENLNPLFGLQPLKRQHYASGQYCDILAYSETGQLVIIELKNQEDRYLVSQLTRYYEAILEDRSFSEKVDYALPVLLKAIAPVFHRDNFTDRKYSLLDIEFLQFSITESSALDTINLLIHSLDQDLDYQVEIPRQSLPIEREIAEPSRAFRKLLSQSSDTERQKLLQLREKILMFDHRLQEITTSGSVLYSRGTTKPCAELRFDAKRNQVALFLWLPQVQGYTYHSEQQVRTKKMITARMRIWTDWDSVTDIGHVPKGLGRMVSRPELETYRLASQTNEIQGDIVIRPLKKVVKGRSFARSSHYKSGIAMTFEQYTKITGYSDLNNALDSVTELSLKTWISRI